MSFLWNHLPEILNSFRDGNAAAAMDTWMMFGATHNPLETPFPWASVSIPQILTSFHDVHEKGNDSHPSFLKSRHKDI